MKVETLQIANRLLSDIKSLEEAQNCFEWSFEPMAGDCKPDGKIPEPSNVTRNPRLIIECDADDGCGRQNMALPFDLNERFLKIIKSEIKDQLKKAKEEFAKL